MRTRSLVLLVAAGLLSGAALLPGRGPAPAQAAPAGGSAERFLTPAAVDPAHAAPLARSDLFAALSRAGR